MIKFILIVFSTLLITVNCDSTPYLNCEARTSLSRDIRAEVTPCNTSASNSSCLFERGTNANFTIFFTPEIDVEGPIEKLIMVKFIRKMKDKNVEVPYGLARCENQTYSAEPDENGVYHNVEGKGLVAGKQYFFNNVFNIPSSAPKTSLFSRYLIREVKPCKKSKCNWLVHPGRLLACVEMPVTVQ